QKRVPYTVERQCGRPFCKLKRRDHFHCSHCHQGFSHYDRLVSHMLKHGVTLPQTQMSLSLNSPNTAQNNQIQVPNDLLYNNLRPSVINVPLVLHSTDTPPSRTANQMKYQVFKASPITDSSANKIGGDFPTADRNLPISNRQSENDAKIVATSKAAKFNVPTKKRKFVDEAAQKISNGQLLVQNYDVPINSISPDLVSN
uniref:C2H2-type domain-containing protein n=1 Tax=Romanomermis culicivorax TaxID=13658 RepID=A0A915IDY3_ROMCU